MKPTEEKRRRVGRPPGLKRTAKIKASAFSWERDLVDQAAEKLRLPGEEYVRNTMVAHARLTLGLAGPGLAPLPNQGDPLLENVEVINIGALPSDVRDTILSLIRLTKTPAEKK